MMVAAERRAREPRAGHQAAAEGLAQHFLGLALAVARRPIDQIDAAVHGRTQRRHAFPAAGLAPKLAQTATAQGQPADRSDRAQIAPLHGSSDLSKNARADYARGQGALSRSPPTRGPAA